MKSLLLLAALFAQIGTNRINTNILNNNICTDEWKLFISTNITYQTNWVINPFDLSQDLGQVRSNLVVMVVYSSSLECTTNTMTVHSKPFAYVTRLRFGAGTTLLLPATE